MDIQKKLEFIKYNQYRYQQKAFNSTETADFFDLDFSKLLYENISKITNSQHDLLSAFDFSEFFSEFNDSVSDSQSYILKFLAIKGVKNVDKLLGNMPIELEFDFFQELYKELHSKDSRPFWFSRIASCLKKEDMTQFISSSMDELSDNEILYLIRDLYEKKEDTILSELMHDEKISEIAVQRVNAPFFYEMIEDLNLPNSLLDRRKMELANILTNYQNYDVSDVKNAFCDLHLHNTLKNSLLDIKTIIDFANDDIMFRQEMGESYEHLCSIYNYLKGDNEYSISNIPPLNSGEIINHEVLAKYYSMCQERFKELVSESINQDVTENIEPRIMISSSGQEVHVYDIENQTEKQRKVTMLVSTIPCSDSATKFKEIYYSENNGEIKNNRRSCSLVNQTKLSSLFGGKKRITFGYEDLSDRIITSATLGDGGTDGNEERFRKHRKVRKSSYSSVDKFVAGTQGHTEITVNMGKTNQVMQPSYILITRENPTQFEIDVASEFQIPIRYVNIEKYRQEPDPVYSQPQDYDFYQFEKKEVQRLKVNEEKSGYDDCMGDDTVRVSSVQNATQTVKSSVYNRDERATETGTK